MLNIKKTTINTDRKTTTIETLQFKDFTDMANHFWTGYIHQLKTVGYFSIDYHTGGDPRMADDWNGSVKYELM